ncbi:MAG: hypothetical protein M3R17_03095 [Bacteroidota bacterium]|nr:hypothetical protein [Bacteroidota bacterium]
MISFADVDLVDALWIILIVLWIVVNVFWLRVMQRALEPLSSFKKMKPENVWLTFIPFFGLYWQFAVVQNVADSLSEEYIRRGIIPGEPRPGYSVGLTANILLCCAFIPTFGILVALVSNISRIIHLVKIKNYSDELDHIIRVQMQNQQAPQPVLDLMEYTHPKADEELKRNNPKRFMPPTTPEQERERWRKK